MSRKSNWTVDDMPDLTDRIAVVTGANSGIGYEVTRALAGKGAHVIMACRNLEKAEPAAAQILNKVPNALLEIIQVDLADLSSVKNFSQKFSETHQSLHILCNNAGILYPPYRQTTDGFEL